jgi:hypothetical protein
MSEILVRIKRAVLDGRYEFSEKASVETFYFLISSKRAQYQ